MTEKLSQEFNGTESQILGALSKLDEFLLNPQIRMLSGTVPVTSRNNEFKKREPTGDRFQSDTCPEVECSTRRTSNSVYLDPEETSHRYKTKPEKNYEREERPQSVLPIWLNRFIRPEFSILKNFRCLKRNLSSVVS